MTRPIQLRPEDIKKLRMLSNNMGCVTETPCRCSLTNNPNIYDDSWLVTIIGTLLCRVSMLEHMLHIKHWQEMDGIKTGAMPSEVDHA